MYKIKMFFVRIKWFLSTINYARTHAREVDNYKFLRSLRDLAHNKYLELDRIDTENPDKKILKIQIELMDKILKYTNGNR